MALLPFANAPGSSGGSGTVTTVSVVSANGLAGTVANATTTPAITLSTTITGILSGNGTAISGITTSAGIAAQISDETGSGALVFANTPTLTTAVLGSSTATTQTPADNSTKVATTAYVDNAVLGQNFKEAVGAATTGNLVGVYLNGSSGVGATFTYAATGVDTIDGVALTLGMRVLVKNQITDFQNGIYTVTTAGAIGIAGILTRATDSDQSTDWKTGDSVFVTAGTTLATTTWAYTGADSPTMGTTSITFAQTAGQGSFTAGNGISITGVSIAIDTSVTVDKTTVQTLTNKTLTSPTLTTPTLGVASATTINKVTITAPATGSTLTIADGKTLTASNTLTFTGTDGSSVAFGTGGTVLYANQTITLSGDITGSGTTAITTTLATVNGNVGSFTNANITVNAKGLITAASNGSGGGFTWNNVTGTTQAAAINNGYIANNASLVTVTLPSTAAVASVVAVAGAGAGGWKLAQNASQVVNFGTKASTSGTGGSLASVNQFDAIEVICITANTTWAVINSQGNILVT